MHPNPVFHDVSEAENLAFALKRGFGTLSVNGVDGPLVSHIPFGVSVDGQRIEAHLVRSNPICRILKEDPQKAVLAVSGPDSYISPDWYEVKDLVPTWNYVAVHIRGELRQRDPEVLLEHLDRLSEFFEKQLLPKPVWKTSKVNSEALDRMMRMIVPVEIDIGKIDGTWKLGQNKEPLARQSAVQSAALCGLGLEPAEIASLMQDLDR